MLMTCGEERRQFVWCVRYWSMLAEWQCYFPVFTWFWIYIHGFFGIAILLEKAKHFEFSLILVQWWRTEDWIQAVFLDAGDYSIAAWWTIMQAYCGKHIYPLSDGAIQTIWMAMNVKVLNTDTVLYADICYNNGCDAVNVADFHVAYEF